MEEMSISPMKLHSTGLQNAKPVPIVRLAVVAEPAQAHRLEQGHWQGRPLPYRVTGHHFFKPTTNLQYSHQLPRRNPTNAFSRHTNFPAAEPWYLSRYEAVPGVMRSWKTGVTTLWIRIRVRNKVSNRRGFFMTLMTPEEAEADQERQNPWYMQTPRPEEEAQELNPRINCSIGPVTVIVEPPLMNCGMGAGEKVYQLLLQIPATEKGRGLGVDHGKLVRQDRWKQFVVDFKFSRPFSHD